jgi:hypothetical protein
MLKLLLYENTEREKMIKELAEVRSALYIHSDQGKEYTAQTAIDRVAIWVQRFLEGSGVDPMPPQIS